ncbi:MAG: PRTRC system protein B [Desulfovibrionaceae bacterium]|nr:PRTRC system protein B [Desulfovibrionaceae bacterium]
MNQAEFQISMPADGALDLDAAVLIYRGAQGSALATLHEVYQVNGEAVIGAGQPMTPRKAIKLSRALLKRVAHGGFLPDNVLYMDGDLIVWWQPPARRHVAFRVDESHADLLGGKERGEIVPHPGLVFAASAKVWGVWAVKGRERPAPPTPLYQAPYFNVNGQGGICQGSVPRPEGTTIEKISAWNDAFFRSYFAHPNVKGKLVQYPGGAYVFWRDMLDARFQRFPERVLIPVDTTLGKLLGMKEGN